MALPGPIVDAAWLAAALDTDRPPVVADVRWYLTPPGAPARHGRDEHERGHIPGAVFVDVDEDLAGRPGAEGRHPLPSPEAFASHMAALGIGDGDDVVAYDDAGGVIAARLWWMLQCTGRSAAVLDGGIASWQGDLVSGTERRPPSRFTARPWPEEAIVSADDVATGIGAIVLDARAPERFRGDVEPVDARAGHIPGARNAPFPSVLDEASGRFLSPEQLRSRLGALGVDDGTDVVAYCGSGVTACHLLLAMAVAGVGNGRLYPGSWSEWAGDPARPAEVGE